MPRKSRTGFSTGPTFDQAEGDPVDAREGVVDSCESSGNSHRESNMGDSPKLAACPGRRTTRNEAHRVDNREGKTTEAYHIDRFGSIDGIVLDRARTLHWE